MKIRKLFLAAAVILAVAALAGCASSGSGGGGGGRSEPAPLPPVPEGAERIMLDNGSYAIYRFNLPAGAKWSDYNKLTVDYMVDEANLKKPQRNGNSVRLMGNYKEEQFEVSGKARNFNLMDSNGPYIIDNTPRTFADMGAAADQWFTVEYNITGSAAHAQFVRTNLPAANDTGPFFFGVGIPAQEEGRRFGITQLVRNVTLHHASNPSLNVVSTGSGFEEPTFISYFPISSTRQGPSAE
jgi:hypothetical protein